MFLGAARCYPYSSCSGPVNMSMENREDHVAFFKPETVVLLELIYHSISQIL
jgi:hypothetical protein